ncbi:MAG: tetratricopeptide repeat protein [Bacteroidia bacterium]
MKSFLVKYLIITLSVYLCSLPAYAQKPKKIADSLKIVLRSSTTDTGRINLLNSIAVEYTNDLPDTAIKYANEALASSIKIGYSYGEMTADSHLGLSYYYSSDYDKAIKYHTAAHDIAQKIHNDAGLATSLNNIGLVYDDKGDYDKALSYYFQALKITEKTGKNKRLLGSLLNNIALIYQTQKKYDQALDFHNKALKVKEEIKNILGVGNSLHNIGLVYKLKGNYDKSLEYYFKALKVREACNDESGKALTLNNIGSVYESKNDFNTAFTYFKQALEIRQHLKNNYNLAVCLYSIGSNYCSRNDYKNGIENINKALEIAKSYKAKELIKYGYESLADAYSKQKKYEQAFYYQKLLGELKDSIANAETSKQVNELQAKYESEKSQKEIELLNKNSEIQSLQLNKSKLWIWMLVVAVLLVFTLAGLFYNRSILKQKANVLLEHQNVEMAQQKKEITDSINYAKRIQESILPPDDYWQKSLPDSFIFYRPKDIVSGDFYWLEQKGNIVCFAAVDCTGHGVPGALMSVVGFNLLTQAVNEMNLTTPSDILKHLDYGVTKTLRQSEEGKGVKDGMDLSLCSLNLKTNELQYAGAYNSLYYISKGIFNEIKSDKFPIGVNLDGKVDNYNNHTVQLQKGDCVFLFSDGYADQFGGEKGKKFKYNKLKELLHKNYLLSAEAQREELAKTFDSWKGSLEQVDDVLVIGVRV